MEAFTGKGGLLTGGGFRAVNDGLQTDGCALWSLLAVETRGVGYLADRRPKILFERHTFHALTGGRFDAIAPDISAARPRGYVGGAGEYPRLARAMQLNRQAALESASWGLGQVMGCNAGALGYANVDDMVARFCDSEDAQLDGVMRFIRNDGGLHAALRNKDWNTVALRYNGPGYKANEYDARLQRCFETYQASGTPDLAVRAAQARLGFLDFAPGAVDGVFGRQTRAAMAAFQTSRHLPVTTGLDERTEAALALAAGF